MSVPPTLKFVASAVCLRHLIEEQQNNDPADSCCYLTRLFETECFTAVSEDLLDRIVKLQPEILTSRLLNALVPSSVRDLNLKGCKNVELMGLVRTLKKCLHVQRLNLTQCTQVIHPELFTFTGLINLPLTTLVLEACYNVTDDVVHSVLKNAPNLTTLNVSRCTNISNNVFLVDGDTQIEKEVSPTRLDRGYNYSLTSIDISGCKQLDTTAVKHISSLCGPNLKCINISGGSYDCVCLLHLAGYSLPAVLDLLLTEHNLHCHELKSFLGQYQSIKDTYIEQYGESPDVLSLEALSVGNDTTSCAAVKDVEVKQNECTNDIVQEGKAPKVDSSTRCVSMTEVDHTNHSTVSESRDPSLDPANINRDESIDDLVKKTSEEGNDHETNDAAYPKNKLGNKSKDIGADAEFHGNNSPNCDRLTTAQNSNIPHEIKVCDKCHIRHDVFLFHPHILSLCMNDLIHVRRMSTELGQVCLRKFLDVNSCLQKWCINCLTAEFFQDIVTNLQDLRDVQLEECTMLQTEGVFTLGNTCRKCVSVNLRGVVFFEDSALVPFLTFNNLQDLNLAESSEITDNIVGLIAEHLHESLTSLDLSYCETLTENGINVVCLKCTNLKKFGLERCAVSDMSLRILSESCNDLTDISLQCNPDLDDILFDAGILSLANGLQNLTVVKFTWYLGVTDTSICVLMKNCCLLEEAVFQGLQRVTERPFIPICTDVVGDPNKIPDDRHTYRSTVYARNLSVLDLQCCDFVSDSWLQRIVNVCRGTLKITDYFGQNLVPETPE